jgi:putative PIN family toxin of toxin-antitoxin system
MLRLVIDTDVLVAAFESSLGASRQLLLDVIDGKLRLLLSVPLLIEYEAVLTRPYHLARSGLSTAEVVEVIDGLAAGCVPVVFDYRWRPSGADADDELVVETAINGQADAIATFNLRHMRKAMEKFGIAAQRPGPLLRRIRS